MLREHDTRRTAQGLAALVALAMLTVPAGPAAAVGPPTLLLTYPEAFTGQLVTVTFSGFTECQPYGAALVWDGGKATLASGVQIGKQPTDVPVRIPDAATGAHTISGNCQGGELVDAGYGASVPINVVPAPHPTITVTPDPATAGTTAEITAFELPTACATGSPSFQLAGQLLAVRLLTQQTTTYLNTGGTVAKLTGTFAVPTNPAGTYRLIMRCQGLLQGMAADLAIAAPVVPTGTAAPPQPIRSSPPARASSPGTRNPPAATPSRAPAAIAGGGTSVTTAQKFALSAGLFVAILIGALVAILLLGRRHPSRRTKRVLAIGHAGHSQELTVAALAFPAAHTVSVRRRPDPGRHHAKGSPR